MSFDEQDPMSLVAYCRNCGMAVDPSGGQFCPMCGWTKSSADGTVAVEAEIGSATTEVSCPACWAPNPSTNRHCEQCAARLGHGESRSVPNRGRDPVRLGSAVVAVIIGLIIVVVLIANGAGDSAPASPTESAGPEPTQTTAEPPTLDELAAPVVPAAPIKPVTIEASSELSADFGSGLLNDGSAATAWNDASLHGEGATLTFRFSGPATLDRLTITNLGDPDRFIRNYRVREYAISIDGAPPAVVGELQDTPVPQSIELGGVLGSVVTFSVVSTFPSEATDSGPGFEELAIAEVEFIGR